MKKVKNEDWHIGCSGFYYKDWKGRFYPDNLPQRDWLDYYCRHFETLESNVTFYRFPQLTFLQSWYKRTPEEFRFAIKAPRLITHYKKFLDTNSLLEDFYNTVQRGLAEKLKCVLFQLPPSIPYNEEVLQRIIDALDSNYPNVLEFRHASWWREEVYEMLGKHNITFCGMSHPDLPAEVIVNTPMVYYQMHGSTKLYGSSYTGEELQALVKAIEVYPKVEDVYIYFNNDMHGHAIENANRLKEMLFLIK